MKVKKIRKRKKDNDEDEKEMEQKEKRLNSGQKKLVFILTLHVSL